jgi:hypothetical protein
MQLSDLNYKIYRASTGTSSFWRWEVLQKRRKAPVRSGYVYGTIASAKQRASAAMLKFAGTGKMRPQNKT